MVLCQIDLSWIGRIHNTSQAQKMDHSGIQQTIKNWLLKQLNAFTTHSEIWEASSGKVVLSCHVSCSRLVVKVDGNTWCQLLPPLHLVQPTVTLKNDTWYFPVKHLFCRWMETFDVKCFSRCIWRNSGQKIPAACPSNSSLQNQKTRIEGTARRGVREPRAVRMLRAANANRL